MSDDLQPELNAALNLLRERAGVDGKVTGCCSFISRRTGCGFNKAARILEHLELAMLITPADDNGARRLLP